MDPVEELLARVREMEVLAREARKEAAQAKADLARAEHRARVADEVAQRARQRAVDASAPMADALVQLMTRLGCKGLVEIVADRRGRVPSEAIVSTVGGYLQTSEGLWCMACMSWHEPDLPMCIPEGHKPDWLTTAMRMLTSAAGHVMMDHHLRRNGQRCSCDDGYEVNADGELEGCRRCRELRAAARACGMVSNLIERVLDARTMRDHDFEREPYPLEDWS